MITCLLSYIGLQDYMLGLHDYMLGLQDYMSIVLYRPTGLHVYCLI